MRKYKWVVTSILLTFGFYCIFLALKDVDFAKLFQVNTTIIMSLACTIVSVAIAFMSTSYLMMQRHRILKIYLSSPEQSLPKIKEALAGEDILTRSYDSKEPDTDDVRQMINSSHFCFFAVGSNMAPSQEAEMEEMKKQNKEVYIIALDNQKELPQGLSAVKPLNINDRYFNRKIQNIVIKYK